LCEIACSLWHEEEFSPREARIRITNIWPDGYKARVCKQCKKKVCISVCAEDAIRYNNKKGAILIDETKCTGCKLCVRHCPFEAIWIHPKKRIAIACDLCGGGEPQCVAYCPMDALKNVATSRPENKDKDKKQISQFKPLKRKRGI
jgi:Fe-S-cluster-containing hydrogenase component 2